MFQKSNQLETGERCQPGPSTSTTIGEDGLPETSPSVVQPACVSDPTLTAENSMDDLVKQKVSRKVGRKRKRGVNKQVKNKTARNLGKSYLSYQGKGKPKSPRKIGHDCSCKKQCFDKIDEEARNSVFEEFNAIGNYNTQNAYLFGLIDVQKTARKTKRSGSPSRRTFTAIYHIVVDVEKVEVCKKAFLSIHGLQKNRGRIETLLSKKTKGSSTPPLDKRGSHGHHKKKYSETDINNVHIFIDRLPKYESHYTRHKNPYKMFMSMEYTVERCFKEYTTFCSEAGYISVSSDKFRRIFTEEFNIGFKKPKTDTCKDCDSMRIDLEQAKKDEDETKIKEISVSIQKHHLKAAAGFKFIQDAPNDKDALVLTFDLQQALPLPKLSTGPAFYKRKCFCYNLSIHDCSSNTGYFYYWDETTASRGSDDIASCILKHFDQQNIHCDKLIVISDNCCGQNKNWAIVALWLKLLASGRVKSVQHVFPTVGHTMLPSDRDFGRVEQYVRDHIQFVYSPEEWGEVLKNAQKSHPFHVYRMQRKDFFKISSLKQFFRPPKSVIASAAKLYISYDNPNSINVSNTYFGLGENISIRTKGRPLDQEEFLQQFNCELLPLYNRPRPVNKEKLDDVLSLLQYIPQAYHSYYRSLCSQ